jgi:uncharacterized membrane protein
MSAISDAKTLGGIGAILVLLTPAPAVGWVLGVVGFAMVLLAISKISLEVRDKSIFNNMLTGVVLSIGAIAVGTVTAVGAFYRFLGMGSFNGPDFVPGPNVPVGDWIGLVAGAAIGLLVVWALLVASAVFVRRSYNSIGSKLNTNLFGTAALLYLIGAATSIIAIGFVLIFVAQILLAAAFFSIPEKLPEVPKAQGIAVNT